MNKAELKEFFDYCKEMGLFSPIRVIPVIISIIGLVVIVLLRSQGQIP